MTMTPKVLSSEVRASAKVFGASANTSRQIKIKQATSKAKVL
jgi:hypothetical protein